MLFLLEGKKQIIGNNNNNEMLISYETEIII